MDKFAAIGLIFDPKKKSILLQHRDEKAPNWPNKWSFFGGSGDPGEMPEEAFKRELREELGLEVGSNEIKLLRKYYVEEMQKWDYVYYIECDSEKTNVLLGEGQGFEWISIEQVLQYDLVPRTRLNIEFFLEQLKDAEV